MINRLFATLAAVADLFPDFLGWGRNIRTSTFFAPFIRRQKGSKKELCETHRLQEGLERPLRGPSYVVTLM